MSYRLPRVLGPIGVHPPGSPGAEAVLDRLLPYSNCVAEPDLWPALAKMVDSALLPRPPRVPGGVRHANHSPDWMWHTPAAGAAWDRMVATGKYPNWRTGQFPPPRDDTYHVRLDNEHVVDRKILRTLLLENGPSDRDVWRAVLGIWRLVVVTREEHNSLPPFPRSWDFGTHPDPFAPRYTGVTVLPPRCLVTA